MTGNADSHGGLDAFRLGPVQAADLAGTRKAAVRRHPVRRSGMFLKGPISWAWLQAAGRLPGRAFHVAVVIQLLAGMSRGAPVSLASVRLRELDVDRHAAYRALRRLEEAGLVVVQRHRGRQPVVTIQHPESNSEGGGDNEL